VDLAGPFSPTSTAGNKYIFVAIEHLSKHVIVAAMQEKSTTTARLFVEHVLCRFGSCAEVITDVGTKFAGDFAELLRQHFIDHRTTSPNHPQADGLAERAVQTVKRVLKKYCESAQKPKEWGVALPWITFGFNRSVQSAIRVRVRVSLVCMTLRVAQKASIMVGNNLQITQQCMVGPTQR